MSASVIRWEDPPRPGPGGRRDWPAIAAELRKRPGAWAHVATYGTISVAGNVAYQVRSGKFAGVQPAGSVEAVSRAVDGECRVYARYVGDGDPR